MPEYQILVEPPRSRWSRILVIGLVVIVVAAVAGTGVYLGSVGTPTTGRQRPGEGTKSERDDGVQGSDGGSIVHPTRRGP